MHFHTSLTLTLDGVEDSDLRSLRFIYEERTRRVIGWLNSSVDFYALLKKKIYFPKGIRISILSYYST